VQTDLDESLHTVLYPPVHDRGLDPGSWFDSYIQLCVERDGRQLINVRNLGTFSRFVRLCEGRTGQMLNRAQLASELPGILPAAALGELQQAAGEGTQALLL